MRLSDIDQRLYKQVVSDIGIDNDGPMFRQRTQDSQRHTVSL